MHHTASPFTRAAFLAASSAALAAAPLRTRAADLVPLRVGVAPTDATAEVYYGHDQGMYKAAGLDVQIVPMRNTGAAAAALSAGAIDIVSGSIVPIAEAFTRGFDFKLVTPAQIYDGPPLQASIGVPVGSSVKTAADLTGKTVAVNGLGDLTHLFAVAWVDANGGDSKNVKFIEIPLPSVGAALDEARVDASMLVEPFMTALRGKVTLLGDAMAAIGKHFMVTCYIGRQAWLDQNKDTAKTYAATTLKVGAWANGHHEDSGLILSHYTPLQLDTIAKMTRAVYATVPVSPALVQPVLDATAKFFGNKHVAAADLIWTG